MSKSFSSRVPKATKKFVKKAINRLADTKYDDNVNPTAAGDIITYATPLSDCLTSIAQGSLGSQRDGEKIQVMNLKGRVDVSVVAGEAQGVVRVLIVRDKMQVRGTSTTLATVLPTYTNARMTSHAMPSILDSASSAVVGNNRERFEVLYDKVKYLSTLDAVEISRSRHIFYINKKLNKPAHYGGALATAADRSKGQIYMYIFTDSTTANAFNISYDMRTMFKDI